MSSRPANEHESPGTAGAHGTRENRRSAVSGVLIGIAFVIVLCVGITLSSPPPASQVRSLDYAGFLAEVRAGHVDSVELRQGSGRIDGSLTGGSEFRTQGPPGGLPDTDIALLDDEGVDRNYVASPSDGWRTYALLLAVPLVLIFALWAWTSKRTAHPSSGTNSFTRSRARISEGERPDDEEPETAFADIAGYDGVKEEVREVVDFLRDPTTFAAIGARVPKGILLVGPPGTGKTLFARAVAGEARVPFISITGSEFLELYVGVGAARVRDLFATARKKSPAIVFIDEIDAIGRKRGTGIGGGHDEREQTLNQILAEMDGFDSTDGIVLLAATNRPDILDPALLRAGRFDRQIVLPLPTAPERLAILEVHSHGLQLSPDADLGLIARGTPGMSGAELANLLNEAALIAVRHRADRIGPADLDAARDRVLIGVKRTSLVLGTDDKQTVAYHEAGHALLAAVLPHADPVHKVTILPAGMALGVTEQMPTEERQLRRQPELEDTIAVQLGGHSAEELAFGVASTGGHDDLVAATNLARHMVREWGMSRRLGHAAWGADGPVFLGQDLTHGGEYSDATAQVIDDEIASIVEHQAQRAHQELQRHRSALDALAEALVQHETLDAAEVVDIIAAAAPTPAALPAPPVTHAN
jgi:cell division protease FtsH